MAVAARRITIAPEQARARAQQFLQENALIRFMVGVPRRMVSLLRSVWIVPIELRYPNYGLVGEVGVVAVDQETGNVVAWTPREEMLTTAGELYQEQHEPIEAARHSKPAEDPRHPLIYQREGAAGYEPAIGGTGVRVRNVVGLAQLYGRNVAQIREALPHLSPEQIQAALQYYDDHSSEIEFFIAENDAGYQQALLEAWERQRGRERK